MRILALEDTLSHQVRMETILAEIADEMGLDIQVKITGKIQEFKEGIVYENLSIRRYLSPPTPHGKNFSRDC